MPLLTTLSELQFFSEKILERSQLTDDPLMFSIWIATTRSNTTLSRAIRRFGDTNVPDMNDLMQNVYERITASTGSRSVVLYSTVI